MEHAKRLVCEARERLLAHELTHTLQQTGGVQRKTPSTPASVVDNLREETHGDSTMIQAKLTMGAPGDRFEEEADAVADRVVQRMSAGAMPL